MSKFVEPNFSKFLTGFQKTQKFLKIINIATDTLKNNGKTQKLIIILI